MIRPLPSGATIGILGGGQLGRMLALAAARLGFQTHIFAPEESPPAAAVAAQLTQAAYDDIPAIQRFARAVDVITYEFENIPTAALEAIEDICPIHPGRAALAVSQDRLTEKDFLTGLGLITAPYAAVRTGDELDAALETIGTPAILKSRRFGYDGKGQVRLDNADQAASALDQFAGQDAILEGFVDFSQEISVIAARAMDSAIVCFDPGENHHKDGILATTTVPAKLSMALSTDAVILAGHILNALNYVGVMGIELFVTPQGLLVNEIAPRVHNSGHWTQNGCVIDQFEQHIRAIAGWPLGDGSRHSNVVMENLIGDALSTAAELACDPAVAVHLYGKGVCRAGRKMGHINRITGAAG